jgi:2-polyprenyl-3-methyl-5-hydroxy-6-metoxy-1,4-benzoquinol methylase
LPRTYWFFEEYPECGTLCDLGAEKGRESILLSDAGYDVTAVDVSHVGLNQIKEVSSSIITELADVYTYDISSFDFILIDSMLHFYKNDIKKETELVVRILEEMKEGSLLINNMVKSKKVEKIFKGIITSADYNIEIIEEKYIAYPDYDMTYHFIAILNKV